MKRILLLLAYFALVAASEVDAQSTSIIRSDLYAITSTGGRSAGSLAAGTNLGGTTYRSYVRWSAADIRAKIPPHTVIQNVTLYNVAPRDQISHGPTFSTDIGFRLLSSLNPNDQVANYNAIGNGTNAGYVFYKVSQYPNGQYYLEAPPGGTVSLSTITSALQNIVNGSSNNDLIVGLVNYYEGPSYTGNFWSLSEPSQYQVYISVSWNTVSISLDPPVYYEPGSGAYYTISTLLVNARSNPDATWSGSGFPQGGDVTITAMPPSGNTWGIGWADGIGNNPRVINPSTNFSSSARWKELQHSSDPSSYSNNSQRKFIRTDNGWYHQVYTSSLGGVSRVWIEHSPDGVNWTLGNGGLPLDNGSGKLPSIDYNGDAVAAVWQEQYGSSWTLVVETFQLTGGSYSKGIRTNAWYASSSYSTNANPNLVWKTVSGSGVCMITWEGGGIYYLYGRLGALSFLGDTWGQLAGTDANSINASLYTVKSDQSQIPTWQIAWQQRVGSNYGSVKYAQFALYKNDTWNFTWVFAPSQISSSSVMNNYQPSMICDASNNWYACWIGDVNGTGDPTSVKVIYTNKSAKSSNVYYMYGMNTLPKSCAINISSSGVGCYFAWSASQPSYSNKLVDVGNTGAIKTLNTSGKDIQMCGGAQTGMSVSAYYPFSTPYYFAKSNNLTTFFPKSSPNAVATERGCFIGKEDAHLFYSFGNMLVNNTPVDFVDAPDTARYDGLAKINAVLVSQPIQMTPTSKFTFTELSTSSDSLSLMSVLADTGYVSYRIDLVDNITGGVIGTVKNTMLTKANPVEEAGTTYLLDSKNIGTRTVKAKITISTNLDNPDVALVKSFSETNAVTAATSQSLTLQPVTVITDYSLDQNFPNPFNPSTQISYGIPKDGMVTLKIFDALGREVQTLVNEAQTVGKYEVTFDGSRLSSGVYFCRLVAGSHVFTRKLMLVK